MYTHKRTTELHLLLVILSVQSIELPVSCHGIKSHTRYTELIPQAATSGSVIWREQNSTHTLCHLRVGHLAGKKQHPNTAISRASPRGHETAPRHCHLAGVTGQPVGILQNMVNPSSPRPNLRVRNCPLSVMGVKVSLVCSTVPFFRRMDIFSQYGEVINSINPRDSHMHHWPGSPLTQVMA